MRLALFYKLSKQQQEDEVKKVLIDIEENRKMLEKNGTFTFFKLKRNEGGKVMEYIPHKKEGIKVGQK